MTVPLIDHRHQAGKPVGILDTWFAACPYAARVGNFFVADWGTGSTPDHRSDGIAGIRQIPPKRGFKEHRLRIEIVADRKLHQVEVVVPTGKSLDISTLQSRLRGVFKRKPELEARAAPEETMTDRQSVPVAAAQGSPSTPVPPQVVASPTQDSKQAAQADVAPIEVKDTSEITRMPVHHRALMLALYAATKRKADGKITNKEAAEVYCKTFSASDGAEFGDKGPGRSLGALAQQAEAGEGSEFLRGFRKEGMNNDRKYFFGADCWASEAEGPSNPAREVLMQIGSLLDEADEKQCQLIERARSASQPLAEHLGFLQRDIRGLVGRLTEPGAAKALAVKSAELTAVEEELAIARQGKDPDELVAWQQKLSRVRDKLRQEVNP